MIEKWQITIERVGNGYVVSFPNDDDRCVCFEDTDSDERDDTCVESTQKLLRYILEHFNIGHSDHRARNVVVNIEETNSKNGG